VRKDPVGFVTATGVPAQIRQVSDWVDGRAGRQTAREGVGSSFLFATSWCVTSHQLSNVAELQPLKELKNQGRQNLGSASKVKCYRWLSYSWVVEVWPHQLARASGETLESFRGAGVRARERSRADSRRRESHHRDQRRSGTRRPAAQIAVVRVFELKMK